MAKTLQQRIRRNRQQKAVLYHLAKGVHIAEALSLSNASWSDFRRWWLYQPTFRQRWSLAGELLRDTIVKETVEKVRQGDDDARRILWTVRDPHFTLSKGLRLKQSQRRKALRLEEAQHRAWGKEAVREAKAEIRQHEKLLRDIELGLAPSIGNSGSNYKPPPSST